MGAGGFINAALSMAAFLSDTITDGDTACLPLCPPRGLLRLLRGDRDLDLYEERLEPLELLEELKKKQTMHVQIIRFFAVSFYLLEEYEEPELYDLFLPFLAVGDFDLIQGSDHSSALPGRSSALCTITSLLGLLDYIYTKNSC